MKIQKSGSKQPLIRFHDIVFTAAIVATLLAVWFFTLPRAAGSEVVIRQNGEVIATLPLSEDTQYEVRGKYDNVFTIRGGKVWISQTDCPNHQCEKTGAISRAGESIVCAPNGVSATITGSGEEAPDAITG